MREELDSLSEGRRALIGFKSDWVAWPPYYVSIEISQYIFQDWDEIVGSLSEMVLSGSHFFSETLHLNNYLLY